LQCNGTSEVLSAVIGFSATIFHLNYRPVLSPFQSFLWIM